MKNKIKLPKGWELKKLEDGLYEVMQKTEGLEIGKDYIRAHANGLVINRVGDFGNCGFSADGENYFTTLCCSDPKEWREATKEEVVSFFEKHLIERYGEDWKNVKIKNSMYEGGVCTNEGGYSVGINKFRGFWLVWNKNGCLFHKGKWAEVLEEKKVATDLSEIDRPYYIDSFGVAGKTDEFKMITKNHMPSKELCEGIIALQQLISFRDNFHEVNGRNTSKISKYVLRLGTSGWSVGNVHGRVTFRELFEFDNLTQAENFLKYHKDLFNELKKLY